MFPPQLRNRTRSFIGLPPDNIEASARDPLGERVLSLVPMGAMAMIESESHGQMAGMVAI